MGKTNYSKKSDFKKEPEAEEKKTYAKITNCKRANVRRGPGKTAEVIQILDANFIVQIVQNDQPENKEWSFISVGDNSGYIMTKLLSHPFAMED